MRDLLHKAVQHNDGKLVTRLLSQGAGVEDRDADRCTPLHKAAALGCAEMVEILIAHGADVNAQVESMQGGFGRGPVGFGRFPGGFPRFSPRQSRDRGRSTYFDTSLWGPLHFAAQGGHANVVGILVAHGAKINLAGERGQTPLHVAARLGRREMVEALVAAGANVNARNRTGRTPLSDAVTNGHTQIVEFLLTHGADVNAKDGRDETPLDKALAQDNEEMSHLLRQFGGRS
jgi:ankyrin repeat protein